jgi:hypothetical protein
LRFLILLSAILFNLAFFFPDYLGWLIIVWGVVHLCGGIREGNFARQGIAVRPACAPQPWRRRKCFSNVMRKTYRRVRTVLTYGFIWGLLVFIPHFIYLYELLLNKSNATFLLATTIYLFIVIYASCTSAIWFLFTYFLTFKLKNYFLKIAAIIFSTFAYFWVIQNYSMWFMGRVEGYPFFNPLIPLAKFKWFLFLYSLICGFVSIDYSQGERLCEFPFALSVERRKPNEVEWVRTDSNDTLIFHLKPPISTWDTKTKDFPPSVVAQKIYHQLANLELEKYSQKYKNLIVVAPESTYPFSLNKHEEHIELWNCVLPENAHLLIGSQRKEGCWNYQTVYWIHNGLIINFYDKKHVMQFVENLSVKWKIFIWAKNLFLKDGVELQEGKYTEKQTVFKISDDLVVIPRICSELFFCNEGLEKEGVIFFFVNDSWFLPYFRKLMENMASLRSFQVGLPIFYIHH